ncbi:CAP domain-containing protein [Sphingobacterium spiritivorum]|uniref:CAP domain-containing protein n=1 Tax=Sphingobacterium spiritivorum TaxID=258 RepID=UPI00191AB626|nr:CAP domain-containing protein [Sphingobacterium spiritivorum]QQT25204.1 CAP domain-containing protein [Sphingobacterium spiritivorum]
MNKRGLFILLGSIYLGLCAISCEKSVDNKEAEPTEDQTQTDKNKSEIKTNLDNTLILQLVNKVRVGGCECTDKDTKQVDRMPAVPALIWNEKLAGTAVKHAQDMETRNYFSHTSPEGETFGQRLKNNGYNYRLAAENIARGQRTEAEVVEAWLNSYGHCKNIMLADVKEMGAARSPGAGFYWVQLFGTQLQ